MVSKRVVIVMLAGTMVMGLLAGPVAATARTHAPSDTMRRAAGQQAADDLADRLAPGTYLRGAGHGPARRSVTEILAEVRGHRDLDTWLGAIAGAIEETSGARVATATPGAARSTDEEAVDEDDGEGDEDVPYTGTFAETFDAGDLDGDGLSDVVTYHWDVSSWDAVLEARSGVTGAVLWERSADAEGSLAWPLASDLTGDGADDLLVYDLEILSDSLADCDWDDDSCWEEPWEATFRWTVGLLSGAEGAAVWDRELDGWIKESFTYDGSDGPAVYEDQYTYDLESVNLAVIPFFGDLDGDGLAEVILNAIDLTEHSTGTDTYTWSSAGGAGLWEGSDSLVAATRVSVIGSDGAAHRSLSASGTGRVSLLWPLTQPDGSADLLWEHALHPASSYKCAYAYVAGVGDDVCPVSDSDTEAVELVLFDGASFEQQWSATVEGWAFAWPVGGDLDADGRNDIGVWRLDESWEEDTQLLSGATGELVWDDEIVIRDVMTVGPLNQEPGDDVIAIDYEEEYSGTDGSYSATIWFQRRDGATGALLNQTAHSISDVESEDGYVMQWLYATAGADGSGDGAPDLTVGEITETVHFTEDDWSFELGPSSAVAESGATGETLHSVERDGLAFLFMASDLDGGGLTEAAEQTITFGDDDETVTFTPLRLTDGTPLWTATTTGAYVFHTWGSDADGNGSGEVYQHVDSIDARHVSTVVTALDGRTGAGRWSLTSRS